MSFVNHILNNKLTVDLHRSVRNQRSLSIPIFRKECHFYVRQENARSTLFRMETG